MQKNGSLYILNEVEEETITQAIDYGHITAVFQKVGRIVNVVVSITTEAKIMTSLEYNVPDFAKITPEKEVVARAIMRGPLNLYSNGLIEIGNKDGVTKLTIFTDTSIDATLTTVSNLTYIV